MVRQRGRRPAAHRRGGRPDQLVRRLAAHPVRLGRCAADDLRQRGTAHYCAGRADLEATGSSGPGEGDPCWDAVGWYERVRSAQRRHCRQGQPDRKRWAGEATLRLRCRRSPRRCIYPDCDSGAVGRARSRRDGSADTPATGEIASSSHSASPARSQWETRRTVPSPKWSRSSLARRFGPATSGPLSRSTAGASSTAGCVPIRI